MNYNIIDPALTGAISYLADKMIMPDESSLSLLGQSFSHPVAVGLAAAAGCVLVNLGKQYYDMSNVPYAKNAAVGAVAGAALAYLNPGSVPWKVYAEVAVSDLAAEKVKPMLSL